LAQRCRSETDKNVLEDLFRSVLSQFKKYHPSGNLKFNNLGIFKSLKLRILTGKNPFNFSEAKFHSKYFGLLWVKDIVEPRRLSLCHVPQHRSACR